jgi:uncharacterized membrane protein YoaK (UPF0700 family)
MGLQGVAARQINSPGINTIVFTTTLISIVIGLTTTFLRRPAGRDLHPDTKRQIWMFFAYAAGAICAGLLAGSALAVLGWLPMLAVLLALGCCVKEAARISGAGADRN